LQRHRHEDVAEGDPERLVQALVGEHPADVLQPVELRRLDQVVVGEAEHERRGDRARGDQGQPGEPGQQEEEGGPVVPLAGRGTLPGVAEPAELA
jgi:hypothetical protein